MMQDPSRLPSSTVTFLFTDIEGSTRLLQQLGDRYAGVLADHHRLLRAAFNERGGSEVQDHGDGFYYSFSSAKAAVAAAVAAQRAMAAHRWPDDAVVHVRMGLHTGEPARGETGLVGIDIHRSARICAAGHGGQVLISQTTRDLIGDNLADGLSLRDLGEHRLKDLARSERLFQIIVPDLPTDFLPLRSLNVLPNNLPVQVTSFVGREREMAEGKRLLGSGRLLTLTGIGGCGKTRLALQVAADLLDAFPDGVWLVELGALADPALVVHTAASVLSVREEPGRPILETLVSALRVKHVLLILDNCEHLLAACASLADALLHSCPRVRILATSREALGIAGETSYQVPSLSIPDIPALPVERLSESEAIRLFVDRATAAVPGFALTVQNASAVATICRRLDGIPLAVELAAPRVKVLTVEQIADRLHDRFRLLTGGSRTALPRQQTLQAAMDWSYALLSDAERILLRRLSVFAGGFTLEAAEAVCIAQDVEGEETLDVLTRLVEKSLVLFQERDARYRLLETVRQYGHERLAEAGEAPTLRERHRDFFLDLAEKVEPLLGGAEDVRWLPRVHAELDNLRAAMEWSLEGKQAEVALRLATALRRFWFHRAYWSEGRGWLERALSEARTVSPAARAKALGAVGNLAWNMGDDLRRTADLLEESVALFRTVGDKAGAAYSLFNLAGVARTQGDRERAVTLFEESLALERETGNKRGIAFNLVHLGWAVQREDLARAEALFVEGLARHREVGDRNGLWQVLNALGGVAEIRGELQRAQSLYREAEAFQRELGNPASAALSHVTMGSLALTLGDTEQAQTRLEEAVAVLRPRSEVFLGQALNALGWLALHRGEFERATALFEESLTKSLAVGARPAAVISLRSLGVTALLQQDYQKAEGLLRESLAQSHEVRSKMGIAGALTWLARLARRTGDARRATDLYSESLRLRREYGARLGISECFEGLADVASSAGQPIRAARLLGAAAALREGMGAPLAPFERDDYERSLAAVRSGLGEEAFAETWAEGRAMTLEQAVECALQAEA